MSWRAAAPRTGVRRARQAGSSIIVVLVLMTVMLLGGLALARVTDVSAIVFGNVASKDASVQATEIGLSAAFKAVKTVDEDVNQGNWYYASIRSTDGNGVPNIDFDALTQTEVGRFKVAYVVERMCSTTPVTDTLQQCLVRMKEPDVRGAGGGEALDPPNSRQFRVTVRVIDTNKGTQTWVQSLVNRNG